MKISGNLIDIHERVIKPVDIIIGEGRIIRIDQSVKWHDVYILPGFIDSHVHIESSMVMPPAFAEAAVPHGTIGVLSDPHEIANVLGSPGVDLMIKEASKVPFYFWFGCPSCVPATDFESAGARIDSREVEKLIASDNIWFLSEVMNYPGVVNGDKEIMRKIEAATSAGKKIDGHAPRLSGPDLQRYIATGISTDHECNTLEEAKEKLGHGMKIQIREGSAARNLNNLKGLFNTNPGMLMLCSDDLHPEMMIKRHISTLAASLINEGFDIFDVLRACSLNAVEHYQLDCGMLREGDPADFIMVGDYRKMDILETWIKGAKVYGEGKVHFDYKKPDHKNIFNASYINKEEIEVRDKDRKVRVIKAYDGRLDTGTLSWLPKNNGPVTTDLENDIIKLVVKDRYNDAKPSVGFINGFGLKKGAFASSIAHDSHNIIAAGTNDDDIVNAVNEVIRMKGGLAVACNSELHSLSLPVAGIMSDDTVKNVAVKYEFLSQFVIGKGCLMKAPFMTLSFMALLVIPELKLSDKGLFDGRSFTPVDLFE